MDQCAPDSTQAEITVTAVFTHSANAKVLKLEVYAGQTVGTGGTADQLMAYNLSIALGYQSAELTAL